MVFGGENAESYYDEGLTASMKGDMPRAIECFQKALQLDRGFVVAQHQLARAYQRVGNVEPALRLLIQVLNQKPEHIPARLDLGYAYLALGKYDEARDQFSQLINLDPQNSRAYLGVAQVEFSTGNWKSAVAQARAAVDLGGATFAALFLLGRAARLTGDSEESRNALERADKLLEKSLELNADHPESYFLRGEVNFVREQYATAIENYQAAEARTEENRLYSAFGENFSSLDILAKIGLCYQRLGKADRARAMGEQILKNNPHHRLGQALNNLE